MYTLGINAAFSDSAACLVYNGQVIAAAEEERFTGVKHAKRPVPFSAYELPFHAIDYCLFEAGIRLKDLDHIAYSFNPELFLPEGNTALEINLPSKSAPLGKTRTPGSSRWDPLFFSYLANADAFLTDGVPYHLKFRFKKQDSASYQWHFIDHHMAHAASAFLPSPFTEAAIMTIDGRGEAATTSYATGKNGRISDIGHVKMPHSLGLLYEEVTDYLGFLCSCDEYKVMSLASYGTPRYIRYFREKILFKGDGQYEINPLNLDQQFGPKREKKDPLKEMHFDIACSLQTVLEETVLELAGWLHSATGEKNLCLAGGVALNCVMNGRLKAHGPFSKIWVQPAAGDAGTALGAALLTDLGQRESPASKYIMSHTYLGPGYTDNEIESFLLHAKLNYRRMEDPAKETAILLSQNKIIGWFQGRMEFGPRALGGRSMIASPLDPSMSEKLNQIKNREEFRPVCPSVLLSQAADWFKEADASPFMLFVYHVRPEKKHRIPAAFHFDGTARIQTVSREENPRFHDLLEAFKQCTGVPILINTSFNTQGKPIVRTPKDAVECFFSSPLDAVVMGPFIIQKQQESLYNVKP